MNIPTLATSTGLAPATLRIALGSVMWAHGAQKLLGWFGGPGLSGTLTLFDQAWGIPAVLTLLVIAAEFLGGLALIAGFLTRISSAAIIAVMVGAVALAHWEVGFFMDWAGTQSGEGYEYHVLAITMALALLLLGGGRASVDGWLARRLAAQDRQTRGATAKASPLEETLDTAQETPEELREDALVTS